MSSVVVGWSKIATVVFWVICPISLSFKGPEGVRPTLVKVLGRLLRQEQLIR